MAKGIVKRITEKNVTYLIDPKIEFVSLVKYPATGIPFKLIKEENKMFENLVRVLIPKDYEDKVDEVIKEIGFDPHGLKKEEQKEDSEYLSFVMNENLLKADKDKLEMKCINKDRKIFGVFLKSEEKEETKGETKEEKAEKHESKALNINAILDTLYYAQEAIWGIAMQDTMSEKQKIKMIRSILDGISNLTNSISEKCDKLEKFDSSASKDNILKNCFEKIESIKKEMEDKYSKLLEDIDKKFNDISEKFKKEAGELITKKSFDDAIKEINEKIDKFYTVKRNADISDPTPVAKEEKQTTKEFKFFTAI